MTTEDLRLGYYLLRAGTPLRGDPSRQYRGVDRLPHVPNPFELDPIGPNGQSGWDTLWNDYWAAEDAGVLHSTIAMSRLFQQQFLRHGVALELVGVLLTAAPSEIEDATWRAQLESVLVRARAHEASMEQLPPEATPLGFDLAWPTPSFHSAIFQPGLDRIAPDYVTRLNPFGLFAELQTAWRYLSTALSLHYGPMPYCALKIVEVS